MIGSGEGREIEQSRKRTNAKFHVIKPFHSPEQGWVNLASAMLLLAIEDARNEKDTEKSTNAKQWLYSSMGKYFIEFFLPDIDINIDEWVLAGCPKLDKK